MEAHNVDQILDGLGEMEFKKIVPFNDGHVGAFWSGAPEPGEASAGPWEIHPETEELLMCVEGSIEVQILELEPGPAPLESDLRKIKLGAGEFTVVPRGHWHRHRATEAFREFYLTPGRTEHSNATDPR